MNGNDFYLSQPYQLRFNAPLFELDGVFNGNLKNLFKTTRNMTNTPKSVTVPQKFRRGFYDECRKRIK